MTIYTFFISFGVIVTIALLKAIDLKIKNIDSLSNFFKSSDRKIERAFEYLIIKYNWLKKISNIFIFEFLPSYLYENLVKMKDYVSKKYYESGDKIRGRRVLRSNGSVSFFLDRLSEERGK